MESDHIYHQREFDTGGLVFFSNFDSGNLLQVTKQGQFTYELQVAADAYMRGYSHYRTWFYFGIRGLARSQSIRLSISNLTNTRAFTSASYRPVFRELPKNPVWQRVPTECRHDTAHPNCRVSWSFQASDSNQTVYFAFAPPYSYADVQDLLASLGQVIPPNAYYYREILTYSPEGRPLDLLTLTDNSNLLTDREATLPEIFPNSQGRPFKGSKPIVMMTCRVHPGETPASFFLEAFLKFLLSMDRRAEILRKSFVFKIVPIINADGVYAGHLRVDQFGVNLNRSYIQPSAETEPAIFAIKSYVEYLASSLYFFLDIHSQSSKRSCWLFGNALDFDNQIENQLFAKLMGINCAYFEYSDCDFSERSMVYKDPKDLCSKEGSARVAIYKATGIIHSYTLECPCYCPQPLYRIAPLPPTATKRQKSRTKEPGLFTVESYNSGMFREIAEGFAVSLLDINNINLSSRLANSSFKSLVDLREHIRSKIIIAMRLRQSRQNIAPALGKCKTN